MQDKKLAIIDFLQDLPDPRQQSKVLYPLNEIFLVAICAIICGADSWVEIEEFGNAKIDFFRLFFAFEHGIPSHDTFGIVFSKIDSKKFGEVFIAWVQSLQKAIPRFIAIDGKTIRRSMDNGIKPIHMVSAWATDQNIVIGQVKVDDKSNEIKAIPELLSMLVLNGAIVSLDAMGCQKSICRQIVDNKADYVVALKKNQKNLYAEVEMIFAGADSQTLPIATKEHTAVDGGHGRVETRICTACGEVGMLSEMAQWPGMRSIARVESITDTGKETRYFISSLQPDARQLGEAVRNHWNIENKLHWVMDVVFREDECRVRKNHAAANFVTLRHISQNMLRQIPAKASMRVKRKKAGWDNDFLLSVIESQPV